MGIRLLGSRMELPGWEQPLQVHVNTGPFPHTLIRYDELSPGGK